MLIILVSWLVVIFVGFSDACAPYCDYGRLRLMVSALAVSGAIFLILELDRAIWRPDRDFQRADDECHAPARTMTESGNQFLPLRLLLDQLLPRYEIDTPKSRAVVKLIPF